MARTRLVPGASRHASTLPPSRPMPSGLTSGRRGPSSGAGGRRASPQCDKASGPGWVPWTPFISLRFACLGAQVLAAGPHRVTWPWPLLNPSQAPSATASCPSPCILLLSTFVIDIRISIPKERPAEDGRRERHGCTLKG